MFFKKMYPDKMIASVYELDWEDLARKYKGVIFDIDNTLVPHGAPADEQVIALFDRLHTAGMKTMLVSNNGEERVKPFADAVVSGYIFKAGKPKKCGYESAVSQMGIQTKEALFIGDQIFTDVWGANRAGIYTMLTDPIDVRTDEIQITVKRVFEKPFRREKNK